MRTKDKNAGLGTEVVFFGSRCEVEPGNCAIRPGSFTEPDDSGISRRELQRDWLTGRRLTKEEHAAGRHYQNAGAFPGKNLEERVEAVF